MCVNVTESQQIVTLCRHARVIGTSLPPVCGLARFSTIHANERGRAISRSVSG